VKWKPDWPQAKKNLIQWWNRKGLALSLIAPRKTPLEPISEPQSPVDDKGRWIGARYRCDRAEFEMARAHFYAEAFPCFETQIGPGSLGTFLGSEPHFDPVTVWYEPCIMDPDTYGTIRLEPAKSKWFNVHMDMIEEGVRRADGRYLVGLPDLIENIDTLAAMRGNQQLLLDLVERPGWVKERLLEINEAFFEAFDLMAARVRDEDGGNAFVFRIWGPGRTAKVQCDFSCMISPKMFREFVQPALRAQCDWLDYSLYHLDGTNAMQHVEPLLEIDSLDAIEWTPQAGRPGGGSPEWFDLYRRIRKGGKSVQAIGVGVDELAPLLDAVGPEGLFVMAWANSEAEAEKMLAIAEKYR
jgi:hypothetical protein